METIIAFVAFAIAAIGARLGMTAGALPSLRRMLSLLFALLLAMRYWFSTSRVAGQIESSSLPVVAGATFCLLFFFVSFIAARLCESYFEAFEPVRLSIADRLLGTLFGFVSGSVIAAAALMVLALLTPSFLPSYHSEALPLALDQVAPRFYRFVELRIAHPPADGLTLLPNPAQAAESDPSKFWQ